MTEIVNLIKLCVGATAPSDLAQWQESRFGDGPAVHVTRMWPKRAEEILAGGSIYWVFKGVVLARQRIIDLQERIGEDGITRCALVLDREIVPVEATPRRAFQGWRYLAPADAPPDRADAETAEPDLPPHLLAGLAELGLRSS